jgi:hypothetical protein
LASTGLTRSDMWPSTRQCAGTGAPASASVPAAMLVVAVMTVLVSAPSDAASASQVPTSAAGCAGDKRGKRPPCRSLSASALLAPSAAVSAAAMSGITFVLMASPG